VDESGLSKSERDQLFDVISGCDPSFDFLAAIVGDQMYTPIGLNSLQSSMMARFPAAQRRRIAASTISVPRLAFCFIVEENLPRRSAASITVAAIS
jgi:hypothetical protein